LSRRALLSALATRGFALSLGPVFGATRDPHGRSPPGQLPLWFKWQDWPDRIRRR